ncbi:MAG: beta-galactosidase [bacterium]|nr:beta-galactosidase [bacterium]
MFRKLILLLLASNLGFAQNIEKPEISDNFIPISVWYSGGKARAPMLSPITENSAAEWRIDLQQIKKLGFNTVRTWVEWASCEPRERQYNFENLKLLCELANKIGLKVFIQMYVDSAPDWIGKKYPDSHFEAQSGAKVKPQSAPGYCSDHQGVRDAMLNFYEQTAKVAVQYTNFFGWDLWSEPHIVNWAYINYVPDVQFCYCPNTMAKFRDWLGQKYGTLERLNQAWYRNFDNWNDVEAPRFGTILSYTDFIDWKNFIYHKLAADLQMRYDAIRRVDKTHVITSHAAVPSIFYSPYNGYGATDDFLMAQQVDFYGTSLYPKHNHPDRHWELWKFSVAIDFSRSANLDNGGFYVGELQAGKGTIGLNIGDPIMPADHRIWMWSALSRGARGINIYAYYPMSSGYESGGYGLINLNGSVTERAINAGKIAKIIHQNSALFLKSMPVPAEIAMVYNPLAQMVGGEQRHLTGDLHFGSLIGYYRFFAENNIAMDFIHRKDLEENDLSQYKLIIIPYPLMFTEKAAAGLKKIIEQGGHALAEARLAWNDERGYAAEAIPGMGLDQVFGVRESSIKMADKISMKIVDNTNLLANGIKTGDILTGAFFQESLEIIDPKNSQIIARHNDGSPAIVESKRGKGKTLLIGSFLGLANHPIATENYHQFLSNLLDWAQIKRPLTCSHDGNLASPVDIQLHEYSERFVLFIINLSEATEKITVKLNTDKDSLFNLEEIIGSKKVQLTAKNDLLTLSTTIPAKQVEVWHIVGEHD